MKKVMFTLVLLTGVVFAQAASAASLSWNTGASYSGMAVDSNNPWQITGTVGWDSAVSQASLPSFDLSFNVTDGPMWTSAVAIEFFDHQMDVASVKIDGVVGSFTKQTAFDIAQWVLSPTLNLATGLHTITVDLGLGGIKAGAQLDAKVSTVPVPAAIWLFGSGIAGLVGFSRRKTALAV